MNLILHEFAHSPYCIPVKRIFEAWSVPFEAREVPAWDRRALIELTGGAYYQVPILEHAGNIVHETAKDSLAVPHYLDGTFCGGVLFPNHCAGLHEILIEQIENDLEGMGFKLSDPFMVDRIKDLGERVMVIRHKERRFGAGCEESWRKNAATLATEFESALAPYDVRLAHSAFLFGDHPVYADFALYGVIGNAEYSGDYHLDDGLSHLKRWQAEVARFTAA